MPRGTVKRKKRNCFDIDKDWADKVAASEKGSYYTQHEFEVVVPGSCVRGDNFVALDCWQSVFLSKFQQGS